MQYIDRAAQAAADILTLFQHPNSLPAPLARMFIRRKEDVPCRRWSWGNQLIVASRGHTDARGFRQWQAVGRFVMKGEKAFSILSPCLKKKTDPASGEEKQVICGFKGTPVFGLDQTDGEPLPPPDEDAERWLRELPLREVADEWGLFVTSYNGKGARFLGRYTHDKGIALGVENLSTWAHELVHAADDRNGKLTELGQHWRSETVAQLGGAVLLKILGHDHESDLGGCWEYVRTYASRAKLDVLRACNVVLERTCQAVALILDTAEILGKEPVAEVA